MTGACVAEQRHGHGAAPSVPAARGLAYRLLDRDPERLRHSAGVAARAADLVRAVGDTEGSLLVAAAWVHDIGYSAALTVTGFHPLDGARFLRSAGWDDALCDLVAHHSGSRFVAAVNGFDEQLREFEYVENAVSDALTVADQTVGPDGIPLSLEARLQDMLNRHGPDSANTRAHPRRGAYIRSAFHRVASRLEGADVADSALSADRQQPSVPSSAARS